MIGKVEIRDFKGLEELVFESSKINIFVGRNNTGKSSALEAIALALSSKNGFVDSLDEDLVARIMERRLPATWKKGLTMQRYFIKLGSEESSVSVDLDGRTLQLELRLIKGGVPESEDGDKFLEFLESYSREEVMETRRFMNIIKKLLRERREGPKQLELSEIGISSKEEKTISELLENKKRDITDELLVPPKLFIVGKLDGEIISVLTYVVKSLEEEKEEAESYKVFFKPNEGIPLALKITGLNRPEEVNDLLRALIHKDRHEEALELIKNEVEYFKDLREVGGELLCSLKNGTFPISFMGDGFLSLLEITFMKVLAEGGAVFIEEPETCLHPGFLDVVARQIVKSAESTQFFIATHNAEFLEYLLEAGKEHLEIFKFVRFYRMPDGECGYEILTGAEASMEILEIKSDLRGV